MKAQYRLQCPEHRLRVHWNIGDSSAACRHTMGSVPWLVPGIRYGQDLVEHSAWIHIFSHLTARCFILRHIPLQLSESGVSVAVYTLYYTQLISPEKATCHEILNLSLCFSKYHLEPIYERMEVQLPQFLVTELRRLPRKKCATSSFLARNFGF